MLVDDAHRLGDDVLALLAGAARNGVDMAISRRPTINRPELAELDEAVVAAGGSVVQVAPLSPADIAGLIQRLTGTAPDTERVQQVCTESAGLPAIAAAIASAPSGTASPVLIARVQQRLAVNGPSASQVARVLALGLDLPDAVLSEASGVPLSAVRPRCAPGLRTAATRSFPTLIQRSVLEIAGRSRRTEPAGGVWRGD